MKKNKLFILFCLFILLANVSSAVTWTRPSGAGAETDPIFYANFSNMQVSCPAGQEVYDILGNGTLVCRAGAGGAGGDFYHANFTTAFFLNISQQNLTELAWQNITNWPTCAGANVLTYNGTTLYCVAGGGGGGDFYQANFTDAFIINITGRSFSDFNFSDFQASFNLNISTQNQSLIAWENITNFPTCTGSNVLTFNGTTLYCAAGGGGDFYQANFTDAFILNISGRSFSDFNFSDFQDSFDLNFTAKGVYINVAMLNRSNTYAAGINNTASIGGWFKGLFNWTTNQNWWLQFNGATLTFNDSLMNDTIDQRTASTTYYPTNVSTLAGTYVSGNNTDLWGSKDDFNYTVVEAAGVGPLTITINFTGVLDFNTIVMRELYVGGAGHEIAIGLWDDSTGSYEEEYGEITDMDGFAFSTITVSDPSDHINNTNVSLRFRHVQAGNPAHVFYLDYVVLVDGFTTITTSEHDALTGRDDVENHPWALDSAATRNISGNLEFNYGYNLTLGSGSWFKGAFDWIINSSSTTYLGFNGTSLGLNKGFFDNFYNYTAATVATYNKTWISTYNATYAPWAYNQTAAAINQDIWVNEVGDTMTGDLTLDDANITDSDSSSYFTFENGKMIMVFRR